MTSMKKYLIGLFSLCMCYIQAQSFSVEEVKQDATALIEGLKTYNPALYLYNPDFDQQVASVVATVDEPLSLVQYYAFMNQIGALSNEGHFRIDAKAVSPGFRNNEYAYLPMEVVILDNRIFVSRYFSEAESFEPFDEILSINGKPAVEILNELYKHIPADGEIRSYQRFKAEEGFAWRYYTFVEQPNSFELLCQREGALEPFTIELSALTREQQVENFRNRYASNSAPEQAQSIADFYTLDIQPNYAYLQLKSFNYQLIKQYKLKANRFYQERFAEITAAGVEHLIIDLRDNSGGRIEFTRAILPFVQTEVTVDFLKRATSWKGKAKTYSFPKQKKDAFTGQIYVLVNGATFSSASEITRYLKEYTNAIVIGEETASRYEGFVAGSSQVVVLPASGIKAYIPLYHNLFPPASQQLTTNRGVLPQVEVQAKIDDIKADRDVALEAALRLIKQ